MSRTIHIHVDIRSALIDMSDEDLVGMITAKGGGQMEAWQIKSALLDELLAGRKVLPVDDACEGFDYVTGCPGHLETSTTYGRLAPVCFNKGVRT